MVRARMRRLAAAALLALPALLAFGRGGYFGVTRVRVARSRRASRSAGFWLSSMARR